LKIFIVGIAGATGFRLASLLKDRGDQVDGLYRRRSQAETLATLGVTGTLGDLVKVDVKHLAHAVQGSDVIVFTAGAGGGDSEAMTDAVDGDGVTKSIAAARAAGIKRFVLVSVFPEAGRRRARDESFEHYIAVKKRADVELASSDLDWVILRPSRLTNEPGVGTISLGQAQIYSGIRRDDVAATLAELVHTPTIRRTILEVTQGPTPIPEAVAEQTRD
jgi:uncharacterized protein YbjT (DUF2867 family)